MANIGQTFAAIKNCFCPTFNQEMYNVRMVLKLRKWRCFLFRMRENKLWTTEFGCKMVTSLFHDERPILLTMYCSMTIFVADRRKDLKQSCFCFGLTIVNRVTHLWTCNTDSRQKFVSDKLTKWFNRLIDLWSKSPKHGEMWWNSPWLCCLVNLIVKNRKTKITKCSSINHVLKSKTITKWRHKNNKIWFHRVHFWGPLNCLCHMDRIFRHVCTIYALFSGGFHPEIAASKHSYIIAESAWEMPQIWSVAVLIYWGIPEDSVEAYFWYFL